MSTLHTIEPPAAQWVERLISNSEGRKFDSHLKLGTYWTFHITINTLTLNDWSRGKQLNLFSENLNVSRGYIAGNSLNLAVTVVVGQHSWVTMHCSLWRHRLCNVAAHRFWRETVSLLDVMWPRRNQSQRALLWKNFQLRSNTSCLPPPSPSKKCKSRF